MSAIGLAKSVACHIKLSIASMGMSAILKRTKAMHTQSKKYLFGPSPMWLDLLLLVFIFVLHILVFICTNWWQKQSLLGTHSFKFGRFASVKSLHAHELAADKSLHLPQYWNSLGVITPFQEEPSHYADGEMYQFRRRDNSVQDMPVFADSTKYRHSYEACRELAGGMPHPKCALENLHTVTLLTNGNSISILTEVTPGIYFSTLLIIYLLSTVDFVAKLLTNFVIIAMNFSHAQDDSQPRS